MVTDVLSVAAMTPPSSRASLEKNLRRAPRHKTVRAGPSFFLCREGLMHPMTATKCSYPDGLATCAYTREYDINAFVIITAACAQGAYLI